ncbi:hypothetical protein RFF05_13745 [Bengtsoniella intestinalis]|uniref:hypothetical protein n=1 Tax=Bengtsoniella intestinalis TaxID=3073143 RepID=UPI00391EEDDE
MDNILTTKLTTLSGIGEQRAKVFARLDLETFGICWAISHGAMMTAVKSKTLQCCATETPPASAPQ